MLDKRQFTQHTHSWISTQHKVALTIMHRHTHIHTEPMPASAFPKEFRGCEKSPPCSHPKERNTHQQLRVQVWGGREKNKNKNRGFSRAPLSQQRLSIPMISRQNPFHTERLVSYQILWLLIFWNVFYGFNTVSYLVTKNKARNTRVLTDE